MRKNFSHGLQLQAAYTWSRSFVNYWIGNPAAIAPGISPVISEYGQNGAYHPNALSLITPGICLSESMKASWALFWVGGPGPGLPRFKVVRL